MYRYENEKHKIFTDEGQRVFIEVRDKVNALLSSAGAFKMDKVTPSGDGWLAMAYVDRLVELGEIKEITQDTCCGQDRVFISG
jgi:hypothetical protein